MNRIFIILILLLILIPFRISAQTERIEGLRDNTPNVFAFINAEIILSPGNQLRNGIMVIRDGIIEDIGRRVDVPKDAWVYDMEGKVIYPAFIDLYSHYGMPDSIVLDDHIHWNPQIRSHFNAAKHFLPDPEMAAKLRSQGFAVVQAIPGQGLMKGSAAIVALGQGTANRQIIIPEASQAISLNLTDRRGRDYPTSQMGVIALLRQSFYDAQWYDAAHLAYKTTPGMPRPEQNQALESLAKAMDSEQPFIIYTRDENDFFRANQITREFGLNTWILGSGKEYRRIDAVRGTNLPVILPLNFPKSPEVGTPEEALSVSLEELRHWYFAPENPLALSKARISFALSTYGSDTDFLKNLRKAVNRGLDEQEALAALTTVPAQMLQIDNKYGRLEKGKAANFFVADGDIFDSRTKIKATWVDGVRYEVKKKEADPTGKWIIAEHPSLDGTLLQIRRQQNRLSGTITKAEEEVNLKQLKQDNDRLTFQFSGDSLGLNGLIRISAHLGLKEMLGSGMDASGDHFTWIARQLDPSENENQEKQDGHQAMELPTRFPSMEYGLTALPEQPRHIHIKNATIWTQGEAGILEGYDMLVTRGIITRIGQDLDTPQGAHVIDATGMHATPGLIDPHIHTSIVGGVNETGSAITSETRITDVMHGDNVWIYRLLAGGITSATLFHGSANPIGGQNAIIKMRWGDLPDHLLIDDAAPGLKLALGENVKGMDTRYPNTRQGTEQIIKDAFQAALEYGKALEKHAEQGKGMPVRRDLQLESILEVIRGERRAHVHAYRQDEMLMMLRVAEDFGFTIGSFEHTLEGYKIADELRDHGAAAVVWTDWSSFKVEAQDGILHNARLLHEVGVLTSLHSDNTQLSTRMNWEAAKTVKTGVDEITAMNFITLHPAIIMGIDHRVGSLETGKDADFVLWNGHPLSSFSIPQETWVDGRKYFDRGEDIQRRKEVKAERARIIDYLLQNDY